MASSSGIQCCHGAGGKDKCSCHLKLKSVLQKYFGYSSFRQGQMEASLSVLHSHDVFVRMATGSGKSLCCSWLHLQRVTRSLEWCLVH